MAKPVIGICAPLCKFEKGPYISQKFVSLNLNYIQAVEQVGAIPFILPIVQSEEAQKEQLQHLDGLLLSGGEDIHPSLYFEQAKETLGKTSLERDIYELAQAKNALDLGLPILGICRGLQILNVACGGTLYQDISTEYEKSSLNHNYVIDPSLPVHSVKLVVGTRLHAIFNKDEIFTNTIHHQAIKKIAEGFIANSYAEDGLIEGFEKKEGSFVIGVQWHPEQMIHTTEMQALFKVFIAEALNWRKNGST